MCEGVVVRPKERKERKKKKKRRRGKEEEEWRGELWLENLNFEGKFGSFEWLISFYFGNIENGIMLMFNNWKWIYCDVYGVFCDEETLEMDVRVMAECGLVCI